MDNRRHSLLVVVNFVANHTYTLLECWTVDRGTENWCILLNFGRKLAFSFPVYLFNLRMASHPFDWDTFDQRELSSLNQRIFVKFELIQAELYNNKRTN